MAAPNASCEGAGEFWPGVYSLYYTGNFNAYEKIAGTNRPIYAGKAAPKGTRIASNIDAEEPYIASRVRKHRQSIAEAEKLSINDFEYRYHTVVSAWVTQAEQFLIDYYRPVWNQALEKF